MFSFRKQQSAHANGDFLDKCSLGNRWRSFPPCCWPCPHGCGGRRQLPRHLAVLCLDLVKMQDPPVENCPHRRLLDVHAVLLLVHQDYETGFPVRAGFTAKDSVFSFIFRQPENMLYRALHPEDTETNWCLLVSPLYFCYNDAGDMKCHIL